LAGGIEGFLEARDRSIERIGRAVKGLARLVHGALGKGAHALGDGRVEAKRAEP
jgi:hypothetical protein